ncbi:MAG TPA: helix-turn-helix transcriptional regulator [Candidatus Elarobacter sp.]|jgi:transcriptional regulator with XRE-family HTH domain
MGFESIGQRVRRLRERQGWTVRHLAEILCVAPSTIRRIERGSQPTLAHGLGLAEVFGVHPDYIGFGKTVPPSERRDNP